MVVGRFFIFERVPFRIAMMRPKRRPGYGVLPYLARFVECEAMAGGGRRGGEQSAQVQMGREKGDEPLRRQPEDHMQVLIHPGLRLLVVEAVEIIDVDRQVGIGRMRAGGRRKKGMILLTDPNGA
jgi:hypothetical protein